MIIFFSVFMTHTSYHGYQKKLHHSFGTFEHFDSPLHVPTTGWLVYFPWFIHVTLRDVLILAGSLVSVYWSCISSGLNSTAYLLANLARSRQANLSWGFCSGLQLYFDSLFLFQKKKKNTLLPTGLEILVHPCHLNVPFLDSVFCLEVFHCWYFISIQLNFDTVDRSWKRLRTWPNCRNYVAGLCEAHCTVWGKRHGICQCCCKSIPWRYI